MQTSARRRKSVDEDYFDSYYDLRCHLTMISDVVRTSAYRRSIFKSFEHIHKKKVLEVGAGTGILSVFACQAGASEVIAVEASKVSKYAELLIKENDLGSRITLVRSTVEDLNMDVEVCAIISEWMGYALLSEWMLPSVIHARNQWLKPGGLMFPDKAKLYIAAVCETGYLECRADLWRDMSSRYRLKLDELAKCDRQEMTGKIVVHTVSPEEVMTQSALILDLDLYTVQKRDLEDVHSEFRLYCFGHSMIHGFCLWFRVDFPSDEQLLTSPYDEPTHWRQCILYVPPFPVAQDDVIAGKISLKRSSTNHRSLAADLTWNCNNAEQHVEFTELLEE